jgi:hypothetical protein
MKRKHYILIAIALIVIGAIAYYIWDRREQEKKHYKDFTAFNPTKQGAEQVTDPAAWEDEYWDKKANEQNEIILNMFSDIDDQSDKSKGKSKKTKKKYLD